MREVNPAHWDAMTAVAFTRNFRGSPHIDTENVGCFYGLSLGEYGGGGPRSPAPADGPTTRSREYRAPSRWRAGRGR